MIKSERVVGSCFGSISHIIHYRGGQQLKKLGITSQQGRLLWLIYDSIQAEHVINRQYLEKIMDLRGPTVTSLLNGLEKKGYILRTVRKEDHRAMQLIITPAGEAMVHNIKEIFDRMDARLLRGMTDVEIQTLRRLLFKVYDNLLIP